MITGFAKGQLADPSAYDGTDCYTYASAQQGFVQNVISDFQNFKLDSAILKGIFTNVNNVFIGLSDQMTACQDIYKIKQYSARVSSISGFLGLGTNLLWSILDDSSNLRTAASALTTSGVTCDDFGNNLAQVLNAVLESTTADEVMEKYIQEYSSGAGASVISDSSNWFPLSHLMMEIWKNLTT